MAVLPLQTWGMQGVGRNRGQQPMNYATGTPNDVGGTSGGGQSQNPAPTPFAPPQLNMGFGMPNSAYANAHMRPGYGMPQGYMRGINIAPQSLPIRFQQPLINRTGGMTMGQMPQVIGMNPTSPDMVQLRRGILPTGY